MIEKVLLNNDDSIFYILTPGKPNPQEVRPENGLDTRSRVSQKQQQGETCSYFSMGMIRNRTGKRTAPWNEKQREIEKIFSTWKKEIVELEKQRKLNNDDSNYCQACVPINEKVLKVFDKDPETTVDEIWFRESLEHLKLKPKYAECSETQLSELLHTYKIQFQELIFKNSPFYRATYKTKAVCHLMIEKYGLEYSKWTPKENNILSLVEELHNNGPMGFNGLFGEYFYSEAAYPLKQKINGMTIYAWKPGTRRTTNDRMGHSIVLIGAKVEKKNSFVYFVDPNDESDPKTPRTIYMNSFRTFSDNLLSRNGILATDYISSSGYAYYNPKFNLKDYI